MCGWLLRPSSGLQTNRCCARKPSHGNQRHLQQSRRCTTADARGVEAASFYVCSPAGRWDTDGVSGRLHDACPHHTYSCFSTRLVLILVSPRPQVQLAGSCITSPRQTVGAASSFPLWVVYCVCSSVMCQRFVQCWVLGMLAMLVSSYYAAGRFVCT